MLLIVCFHYERLTIGSTEKFGGGNITVARNEPTGLAICFRAEKKNCCKPNQ